MELKFQAHSMKRQRTSKRSVATAASTVPSANRRFAEFRASFPHTAARVATASGAYCAAKAAALVRKLDLASMSVMGVAEPSALDQLNAYCATYGDVLAPRIPNPS